MDGRLVQDSSMAVKKSPDIFEKCARFTRAKELISAGLYPYFRVIESAQDPEVIMNGKRMIMVGSNNYLGLTNHPKVKEACIDAVNKYGSGCAGSRFLNGTLLNALQQTTVEDVQLVHLKLDQTYLFTEGTKAKTNGSKVIPGTPPTVTEKTVLTLDGNDSSATPGDQVTRIKEAIDNYPYFRESLDRAGGVSWKNSSTPQLSPETGKAIVTFTLECRYPEKTR